MGAVWHKLAEMQELRGTVRKGGLILMSGRDACRSIPCALTEWNRSRPGAARLKRSLGTHYAAAKHRKRDTPVIPTTEAPTTNIGRSPTYGRQRISALTASLFSALQYQQGQHDRVPIPCRFHSCAIMETFGRAQCSWVCSE